MLFAYAEIINGDRNMGPCDEELLPEALAKGWRDGPFEVAIAVAAGNADEPMHVVGMCDAGGQIWKGDQMLGIADDFLLMKEHGITHEHAVIERVARELDEAADAEGADEDRFDVEAINDAIEYIHKHGLNQDDDPTLRARLIDRLYALREVCETFQPDATLELAPDATELCAICDAVGNASDHVGLQLFGREQFVCLTCNANVKNLAFNFAKIVTREFTEEALAEINKKNETYLADDDTSGCCATHEFCDANMLMDEAFNDTVGRVAKVDSEADARLWSAAWTRAMVNQFDIAKL